MKKENLLTWLEDHDSIEWLDDEDNERLLFRNTDLEWYKAEPQRATAIDYWKLNSMTLEELEQEINRGLLVEGITRVTGYFAKVSSWNPGKLGELKARNRKGFGVSRAACQISQR